MKKKCAILVNSCDSYEDAWNPFFKLIKKYWPTRQYPIFLNTETKKYKYENMNVKAINCSKKNTKTWSSRIIEVLQKIETEYIIFFMDDFYISDYVDEKRIEEIINWMDEDPNIAVFSLNIVEESPYKDYISEKYPGYYLRNKKGPYRFNCQAAIWRKDILIKLFRRHESAWDWELLGNRRSSRLKYDFYTLIDRKDMIFKYDCENIGIVRGKWRLPETKLFFEKEGIKVNFANRNEKNINKIVKVKKHKIINRIKLFVNKLRSLF